MTDSPFLDTRSITLFKKSLINSALNTITSPYLNDKALYLKRNLVYGKAFQSTIKISNPNVYGEFITYEAFNGEASLSLFILFKEMFTAKLDRVLYLSPIDSPEAGYVDLTNLPKTLDIGDVVAV